MCTISRQTVTEETQYAIRPKICNINWVLGTYYVIRNFMRNATDSNTYITCMSRISVGYRSSQQISYVHMSLNRAPKVRQKSSYIRCERTTESCLFSRRMGYPVGTCANTGLNTLSRPSKMLAPLGMMKPTFKTPSFNSSVT